MKSNFKHLEAYRIRRGAMSSPPGLHAGAFSIPFLGRDLTVIASDTTDPASGGWEHVSISLPNRCPNWIEMCFIKDLFWDEHETVIQFHPPKSKNVNNHPYCLHLWKNINSETQLPPSLLVGIPGLELKTKEQQ